MATASEVDIIPYVRLPHHVRDVFRYRVPEEHASRISPGSIVRIPFRGKDTFGVILERSSSPSSTQHQLKEIISVLDAQLTDVELEHISQLGYLFRV